MAAARRDGQRIWQAAQRAHRRLLGCCLQCGAATERYTKCLSCRVKDAARTRRDRARAKEMAA